MAKSSGYSGWDQQEDGKEVNSRTETKDDGSSTEHHLWNNSGDSSGRTNHEHVIVNKDSNGRTTSAHTAGKKEERDQSSNSNDDTSYESSGK